MDRDKMNDVPISGLTSSFQRKATPYKFTAIFTVLGFIEAVMIIAMMRKWNPSFHNVHNGLVHLAQQFMLSMNEKSNTSTIVSRKLDVVKVLEVLSKSSLPKFDGDPKLSGSRFVNGSVLNPGDHSQLAYSLMKALCCQHVNKERKLRIGVIGGSISAANYLTRSEWAYYDHIFNWFNSSLAHFGVTVSLTESSLSATGSLYFSLCLEEYINVSEVDLLMLEFNVNDALPAVYMPGHRERGRPLEELIRAIWRVNPMVQLMLVNFPHMQTFFKNGVNCNWIDDQEHLQVAQRYNIPSIGWKHMFCQNGKQINETDLLRLSKQSIFMASDKVHPNWVVHNHIATFLIAHLRSIVQGLTNQVLGDISSTPESEFEKLGSSIRLKINEAISQSKNQALYKSTWIDGSDCFTSFVNGRQNATSPDRLWEAMTDSTLVKPIRFEISAKRRAFRNFFKMDKLGSAVSLYFDQLNSFRRSNCVSLPHVALALRMCVNCDNGGNITGVVSFEFSDNSIEDVGFQHYFSKFPPYAVTFVIFLRLNTIQMTEVGFCTENANTRRNLTSIHVTIRKTNAANYFLFQSVIFAYDCCDKSGLYRELS